MELLAEMNLSFASSAEEFYRQVYSCNWFLVPELNSRKFLVN